MKKRTATAQWKGGLPGGNGTIKTESGTVDAQYSFSTRFEEGKGTNPEELIGAAHSGCFSMALSKLLTDEGFEPESVNTKAEVALEQQGEDFVIPSIKLNCEARVPGIDEGRFKEIAEMAKTGCPVSQALKSVNIELSAQLT